MIFLATLLLLAFLFLLGLLLSLLVRKSGLPHLRFVLAPHFGFSLLVVIVVNTYMLNIPIGKMVPSELPVAWASRAFAAPAMAPGLGSACGRWQN